MAVTVALFVDLRLILHGNTTVAGGICPVRAVAIPGYLAFTHFGLHIPGCYVTVTRTLDLVRPAFPITVDLVAVTLRCYTVDYPTRCRWNPLPRWCSGPR